MSYINIMADKAKLGFFFILLAVTAVSCERNKNDVIPDVYVDFTMNLNDIEFVNLSSIFGSVYVNASTNNWGQKSAGFNNNGIIVFAGPEGEFYAYDRTCPHDYFVSEQSVKIGVADIIFAECPVCKTRYALTSGGTPLSDGTGKHPLKNYRTSIMGNYLHVWNH
jgi:nitrite reductase/ring-hydroxylating ferredoxin subunit